MIRAPRSALGNVSNAQSNSICGSSSFDWRKTPTKESQVVLSASAQRMKLNIRRALSKSYGDLSNLRPRSPPIQNLPAKLRELHHLPGNHVDDTKNCFSSSYNRQARQSIPRDWVTGASGGHPSTTTERSAPTGQLIHHSPMYGICISRHMEAEPDKISIQGLTSGYVRPGDFCVPVTRPHPGDEDQRREGLQIATGWKVAVEHIDISTVWNGLSDVDANELFRVHRAFILTLERMLANELWQIYQQLQQQDSAGNISPIHTLSSTGIVRGISFCRDQLVSEMAETLYSSKENAAKAKSGFLRLFLVTTDALLRHHEDSSRDTSITIRIRCDPLSPTPYPLVDAAWVPDFLMFEGLNESVLEGQCLSVVPKYCSRSAFRPNRFPKNVKYSIEPESRDHTLSWLVWDHEIVGFKGIVPFYSEVNGYDRSVASVDQNFCETISHSLKIIVKAVLVDDNGSSIRYERILRVRLTINVVPWYVNGNAWETKELLSVPKAYQDARLASAAQGFDLQDLLGAPCHPEQSLSRLSQCSNGALLRAPKECANTGQVAINDNHPAMSSSVAGAQMNETMVPELAQTQAYLVAKCARLTSELENIKEQIKVSTLIGKHNEKTLQAPDPQESSSVKYSVPSSHQVGQHQPTRQSSIPWTSWYTSKNLITSPSPSLHRVDNTSQLGRFPALPSPAIGLRASPKSDFQSAARSILDASRTGMTSTPAPGTISQSAAPEGPTTYTIQSTQETDYLKRLPAQASNSSNDTSGSPSAPPQSIEAPSDHQFVKGEQAGASSLGKYCHTSHARSSVSEMLQFKRFEETSKNSKQDASVHAVKPGRNTLPPSSSEAKGSCTPTQWSRDNFYNSFGPLRSLRSSNALANEDFPRSHASERGASTDSSENTRHCNQDSGCCMDTKITASDDLVNKTLPPCSIFEERETLPGGFPLNSFSSDWSGQPRLCQSASASFSPRHIGTSSTSGSRSTSSDMEIIVEQDPRARGVSRQEQAKAWKLLSHSDEHQVDQPRPEEKEVRLSEDERKAMEEAMQRSLDDLAQGFDDIFLEDSGESSSGDGDL